MGPAVKGIPRRAGSVDIDIPEDVYHYLVASEAAGGIPEKFNGIVAIMVDAISTHVPGSGTEPLSEILIFSRHKEKTPRGKGLAGKNGLNAVSSSPIISHTKGKFCKIGDVRGGEQFHALGVSSWKGAIEHTCDN